MDTPVSKNTVLSDLIVTSPRRRVVSIPDAYKTVFFSALPVFLSLLTNLLTTTVTIFFLSRDDPSPTTIAGIGLGITLNNCLLRTFIIGYNVGMTTLASQERGKGNDELVPQFLNRTLISGTGAILVIFGVLLFLQQVLYWIGIEPEVADLCAVYGQITLVGFLFHMYYDTFR